MENTPKDGLLFEQAARGWAHMLTLTNATPTAEILKFLETYGECQMRVYLLIFSPIGSEILEEYTFLEQFYDGYEGWGIEYEKRMGNLD